MAKYKWGEEREEDGDQVCVDCYLRLRNLGIYQKKYPASSALSCLEKSRVSREFASLIVLI